MLGRPLQALVGTASSGLRRPIERQRSLRVPSGLCMVRCLHNRHGIRHRTANALRQQHSCRGLRSATPAGSCSHILCAHACHSLHGSACGVQKGPAWPQATTAFLTLELKWGTSSKPQSRLSSRRIRRRGKASADDLVQTSRGLRHGSRVSTSF